MKYVSCLNHLLVILFFGFLPSAFADEKSCECPKLGCDPCSIEKGVSFYTSKCGPAESRLQSCARPTCIPIEAATKECPVPPQADSGPREPVVLSKTGGEVQRETVSGSNEVTVAGKVKVISGSVSIVRTDGKTDVVNSEAKIHEGDQIVAGHEAGAVVNFEGGNKLHVQPDSTVEIKEFRNPSSAESRKALLNLIKGKVRNEVNQKYNGKSSYYRIMTKTAVAGVRGTDFVMSYSEDQKLDTKIETLEGKVILSNLDESDRRILERGDAVSFVADVPGLDDVSVPKGRFTEMIKMSVDDMRELASKSRMDVARAKRGTASVSDVICQKPSGSFNQCMWRCANNPANEKSCRTDISGVRCVRSRCNGNGSWADEARLPASASGSCPASGTVVRDCDY